LADVKRNKRDPTVPMATHFDQYSWCEQAASAVAKAVVVGVAGCAALATSVLVVTPGLLASVATAATVKTGITVLVVACSASLLYPVVAVVASVCLLKWWLSRD
jgi:hypothetical protein